MRHFKVKAMVQSLDISAITGQQTDAVNPPTHTYTQTHKYVAFEPTHILVYTYTHAAGGRGIALSFAIRRSTRRMRHI